MSKPLQMGLGMLSWVDVMRGRNGWTKPHPLRGLRKIKFRASELMKTGIIEHDQAHGQRVSCTGLAAAKQSSNFDERTNETGSYRVVTMSWTTRPEPADR